MLAGSVAGIFIMASGVVVSSISSFFKCPFPSGSRMINREPGFPSPLSAT